MLKIALNVLYTLNLQVSKLKLWSLGKICKLIVIERSLKSYKLLLLNHLTPVKYRADLLDSA